MKYTSKFLWWVAFTLLFLPKAQGYQFTQDFLQGTFWRSFPIQMHRYSQFAGSTQLLQELTDLAEAEWERAAGQDLWTFLGPAIFSTNAPANSNIIRYSDHFTEETGFDDQYTLAVATRFSVLPYIVRTEIILNSRFEYLKTNQGNNLYKTILHEMGHTLGLDHSDQVSIMSSHLTGLDELASDDLAGVSALVHESKARQEQDAQSRAQGLEREGLPVSCATVTQSDQGDGPGPFLPSFCLGMALMFFLPRFRPRQ